MPDAPGLELIRGEIEQHHPGAEHRARRDPLHQGHEVHIHERVAEARGHVVVGIALDERRVHRAEGEVEDVVDEKHEDERAAPAVPDQRSALDVRGIEQRDRNADECAVE